MYYYRRKWVWELVNMDIEILGISINGNRAIIKRYSSFYCSFVSF